MDAGEDIGDAKLYRASGELLPELQAKLPQLVWCHSHDKQQYRKRVLFAKSEELVVLLEKFQEWPQLLDGHLASFLQTLCEAFLFYVTNDAACYETEPATSAQHTIPLPRAVCRLLYVLCKVRGQKVVVRFFNNEPKYIQPILDCLRQWSAQEKETDHVSTVNLMTWEERYIMLLWLSHLMLAPFDLSSIAISSIDISSSKLAPVLERLPTIAQTLLQIAFNYLHVSSKERDAAAIMIVRLSLRSDMKAKCLLPRITDYALFDLKQSDEASTSAAASAYRYSGLLSMICGILTVGSDDDVASTLGKIFGVCIGLATSEGSHEIQVRNTAPVRKLLVKAVRLCTLHALSLVARQPGTTMMFDLDTMLVETIQYLLDSLSDKDTPVRMIASKSLSMIALKLEPEMSAEVVQVVLGSLNENILLEDSHGKTFAITEVTAEEATAFKKVSTAVDPLRWHGLMLTLGHLLFRRSPPPSQLGQIISSLISGLEFEQRSNVGTSVGVGVRDAACFGIWSLARKYSTVEIEAVESTQLLPVIQRSTGPDATKQSTLQVLANQLVLSACLDPSGNIRRGSSAALQELIGRHPDTILQGIPVVQVVDYHAVARRSRAMIEISLQAAELDAVYLGNLLEALLGWRGARSADTDSRRWAAEAIHNLFGLLPIRDALSRCLLYQDQATRLKASNAGSNAGVRHGVLLSLSAILRKIWARREDTSNECPNASPLVDKMFQTVLQSLDVLVGTVSGRVTRDLELVFEATASLVAVLTDACGRKNGDKLLHLLERCLIGSEKDIIVLESTKAFELLFQSLDHSSQAKLMQKWLHASQAKLSEYRCRGRIEAIGTIFWLLPSKNSDGTRAMALAYLEQFINQRWPIETKVYTMESLKKILHTDKFVNEEPERSVTDAEMDSIANVILTGLNDYTIDQRGDIGSTLRLKSIEAAKAFVQGESSSHSSVKPMIQNVARLAAEKLDKLRLQAWFLIQSFWKNQHHDFPILTNELNHLADISSFEYYAQLCELLSVSWLQQHVIRGLVSSTSAGTEDIGRASRNALTIYMLKHGTQASQNDIQSILDCLVKLLEQTVADEREAVSTMETLAFLLEQLPKSADLCASKVVHVMAKAHTPTSTIQRLEAAIKLYSALYNTEQSKFALDKLTRLLLHRYPKIRNDAADTIFFHTMEESFLECDWTLPVAELKPTVLALRKKLAIV